MEARLVVVGGKANKSEVRLKLPAMVGRSRDADVTVSHASVSRHHCLIYELEGALVVRDNGSLNGTVVDGEKIQEALLRPGQSLTIGPLTFRAEYDHEGLFPSIGSAPAASNGQARGKPSSVAKAEPPPMGETKASAGAFSFLAEEPAAATGAASAPNFNFLGGDESAAPAAEEEAPAIADAVSTPADVAATIQAPAVEEPPPDAHLDSEPAEEEAAIHEMAPAVEESLPDSLLDSEPAEEESGAGAFGFLADEAEETADASSKPSFGFLAGENSGEAADEDDSGAIFRFADDSSAPKEKSPAAAGKDGAAAKAITTKTAAANGAAKAPAAEGDDAALNDFLNSLGLDD